MKMTSVWKESFRLYKKNFGPLCLALLVQLVLRAIALSPLMFLADKALAPLAYFAIPLYLLIVLPARQNYALALQEMLRGSSVFSLQLIATNGYWRKLLRGLKGTVCILLWSAVTIVSAVLLYGAYEGRWGLDVLTLMRLCSAVGGDDLVGGLMIIIAAIAASALLILVGCAVHSGSRHAAAMGDKWRIRANDLGEGDKWCMGKRKLLKGRRLGLAALWFSGLVLVIPFAAVVIATLGDYALTLIGALKNFSFPDTFALNGRQIAMLAAGAVLLLFPLLPLKNLLPAVYLDMAEEKTDAAA